MSSPAAHTRKDMTVVTQVSVQVPGAGGQLGGSVITRVRGDEGLGEVEVVRMGRKRWVQECLQGQARGARGAGVMR